MELAIHIVFLASAIVLLVAMSRWDAMMLQRCEFSGDEYIKWFRETDESFSFKRIATLAAIVVTMANLGIYVEAIVAAVILVLAIALLCKRDGPLPWRHFMVELAPMLVIVAVVVLFGAGDIDQSLVWAARMGLLLAVLSSAFALLANKLCKPITDKQEQTNEI
ncbi:MAG: hypothetical protein J6X70_09415 [Muribaculaceae bacterium]|nr:hypothetical protein [Muribaculaceae bacterium]